MKTSRNSFRAFTLIELLVVIGIIAILAAITIPGLVTARQRGFRVRCASNLRQIGTAVKSYLLDNNNHLPKLASFDDFGAYADVFREHLDGNYDVFKCPAQKYDSPPDGNFDFPSAPAKWISYEFNGYINGGQSGLAPVTKAVTNATTSAYCYDWPFIKFGHGDFRSHPGGINVLYMDSHVAWLNESDLHVDASGDFRVIGHK